MIAPRTVGSGTPPGVQLQLRFEQIKQLPRQQQDFVLHFLDTVLETTEKRQAARRSASASSSNGGKRASQAIGARKK